MLVSLNILSTVANSIGMEDDTHIQHSACQDNGKSMDPSDKTGKTKQQNINRRQQRVNSNDHEYDYDDAKT